MKIGISVPACNRIGPIMLFVFRIKQPSAKPRINVVMTSIEM